MKTAIALAITIIMHTATTTAEVVIYGEEGQAYHEFMLKLTEMGYSGSILVGKNGKILISNGYGYADRENKIPNTPDTVFTFGSITKQFTAAAILKLQEQDKLKVSDKMSKFWDVPREDQQDTNIHHLLTHTAGYRTMVGDDFDPDSRDDVINGAMDMRIRWKPGERHVYSNLGYSLLGAIVEIASGQPYEQYMRDHLFEPAGMQNTGYMLADWSDNVIAKGYEEDGTLWGSVNEKPWADDGPYWNLRANGGIMSTVEDMFRWHRAIWGDTVLSEESREQFFKGHVPENREETWFYCYGWATAETERGTRFIGHNGGNGIFFADFRMYPQDGVVIIYTCNDAQRLTAEMERLVRKQALNPPAIP